MTLYSAILVKRQKKLPQTFALCAAFTVSCWQGNQWRTWTTCEIIILYASGL